MKHLFVILVFIGAAGGLVWMTQEDFEVAGPREPQNLSQAFAFEIEKLRVKKSIDERYFQANRIQVSDLRVDKKVGLDILEMKKAFSNNFRKDLLVQVDVFDDTLEKDQKIVFQISLIDQVSKNKFAEFSFSL